MEWIDCKIKQPSKFNYYLTMNINSNYVSKFGSYKIYKYRPKEKIWWWYGDYTCEVTHWMPLPLPPKKENKYLAYE